MLQGRLRTGAVVTPTPRALSHIRMNPNLHHRNRLPTSMRIVGPKRVNHEINKTPCLSFRLAGQHGEVVPDESRSSPRARKAFGSNSFGLRRYRLRKSNANNFLTRNWQLNYSGRTFTSTQSKLNNRRVDPNCDHGAEQHRIRFLIPNRKAGDMIQV